MDHHDQYLVESCAKEPWPALLGRFTWFVVGPVVLFVLILLILFRGSGWFTAEDWCFFAMMAAMIWGRWLEIRTGYGRTAACKPPTIHDFRRYVSHFVPWALLVWTTANLVGNHLLHLL